jgi:DNA mismatch repair protein MutS
LNLADLNVESELIPFFDISLNRHSREVLSSLFYTLPKTTAVALERQQVLAAFAANLGKIKNLQSYKADIEEAYEFCCRLQSKLPDSISKLRQFRIRLLFSRKEAAQFLSKSVQLLLLFEKIYQHYLSRLDVSEFPAHYRESIRNIVDTCISCLQFSKAASF